jgi:radical SAM protein with 4Fe4S-binding SPASM domain
MKRKQKIMSLDNFKKILDNVMNQYKLKRMTMSGFGEPFVDKEIFNKIKYANEKYPTLKIDIYTNASLLTKELVDKLFNVKVDRITFSINGTKNNYKKIMGLDYENTKKNVLYFLEKKKEFKSPVLCNISLMILEENSKDVSDFIQFWEPLSNSVRIYPPSDWAGGVKSMKLVNKSKIKKKQWPCFVLWNNITVDVDGNVIMCCRDYESRVKFGNLLKEDIKEIRNSEKFKDLKNKQLNFNFSTPVCSACDNSSDSSFDWIC